ncbi:MAG: hypothetical protein GXP55_09880 [Deltaproteobacteria bacterium]|nr:hypothetical protein [Deltaproteobacteria bacterium]
MMQSDRRPKLTLLLALTLGSALLGTSVVATGQDPAGARGRGESAAPGSGGASDDDSSAGAETSEVEEGGNKVKVIRFTGLDISGRLKSPQLLYFLNRLRAEFDRPKLPHRSFIPELVRSAHEDSF